MTGQIEKWRAEFESTINVGRNEMTAFFLERGSSGEYSKSHTQFAWRGYLLAKQSQPVVKLPESHIAYHADESVFDDDMVKLGEMLQALDQAGIKYE